MGGRTILTAGAKGLLAIAEPSRWFDHAQNIENERSRPAALSNSNALMMVLVKL